MLDLERFTSEKLVLMPIINDFGVFEGRRFTTQHIDDGWYWVRLGNDARVERKANVMEPLAYLMESNLPTIRGYWIGDAIVPYNFAEAKYKGFGETIEVFFGQDKVGMPVVCRIWENGVLLYQSHDMSNTNLTVYEVMDRFDANQSLEGLKEVTPEMRYFYFLMSIQRDHLAMWKKLDEMNLSAQERAKRIEDFKNSLAGRLQTTIESAGAKLLRFNKKGEDQIEVVWKLGDQTFNSIIDMNFRMLELGYCAEGHDKDHTISSAINLARIFQDEELIHITRE